MRKIDKKTNFSTAYKEWLDTKEITGKNHPKYNSSFRFYNDVKFDLLRCQKGLCAYTEMRLSPLEFLTKDNWEDGKYKFEKDITKASGELEHFDESLKSKKSDKTGLKDWLWDNLFMADNTVNRDKSTKPIDKILKPDEPDYDPLKLLEFDFEKMVYIPNNKKTPSEQEQIEQMIKVLGINYPGHVKPERERYVKSLLKEIEYGIFDKEEHKDEVFPTVIEMLVKEYNLS